MIYFQFVSIFQLIYKYQYLFHTCHIHVTADDYY